jgi:hypothetical protein
MVPQKPLLGEITPLNGDGANGDESASGTLHGANGDDDSGAFTRKTSVENRTHPIQRAMGENRSNSSELKKKTEPGLQRKDTERSDEANAAADEPLTI